MDATDKKKQQDNTANTPETVEDELRPVFQEAFLEEAGRIEAELADFMPEMKEEQKIRLKAKVMADFAAAEEAGKAEDNVTSAKEKHELSETEMAAEESKTTAQKPAVAAEKVPQGEEKKKSSAGVRRKPVPHRLYRKIAVVAAVFCVAVLGLSVQSHAGKDGIWRSIQRLIGSDSRWEQKDNGERREYSDPEELKTIQKIEETLNIKVPEFFYWPDDITFVSGEVLDNTDSFTCVYEEGDNAIFFQGWKNSVDISDISSIESSDPVFLEKYEDIEYTVFKSSEDDSKETTYNAIWVVNNNKFQLSNIVDLTKMKKILKNIKN